MASFNKVILVGHLTADVELKQTQSGVSVCTFSIGVNRCVAKDAQPETDFINIVAWRNTAEFISRFFHKGDPILVCGHIQTRNYTDNHGNKRYVTEVVADEATFVSSKNERNGNTVATYTPDAYTNTDSVTPKFESISEEEDLPF